MASINNFLSNLGDALSQQFEIGDNKNRSLDILQDGHTKRYGKLGDFANKFDQSAERSYTEEGSFRTDYYNPKPKQLEILMQDPDITVLVKKRAFSSLAENFRPDLMDEHERLFYKTTKVLFQNKCNQISAYEKLSKISKVSADIGRVDYHLLPIIFSLTDSITQIPAALGANGLQDSINGSLSKFKNIVDRVREIYALSQDSQYTSWITNVQDSFKTNFGEGTGIIEFTNVTSLSTTTTLNFAQGSFSLEFIDPYEIMLVTNLDIEQAISDATNKFYNNSFTQLGIQSLDETITLQKNLLNANRQARGASPITFIVEPDTFLGKRVRAIIENVGFEINFDASSVGNIIGSNNIDPSALFGSSEIGNNGLNPSDVSLFNNIVSSLYTQISIAVNTRRQAMADNQDPSKNLNLLRKKLRLHYGNKLVIQPMDNVHIYISSKKKVDTKILGGLQSSFGAQGFLQGLNNLTQNIKDIFAIDENYSLEKSIFVGSDFPNWLWQIMRSQFVSDKNGSHVFAGIVDEASSSYSSGFFKASVRGSDNAGYFNYGVVNFKPSIDVFNGSFYDPMTPFKLETDSVTGVQKDKLELLDENKNMFSSAFVKDKNGLYAGINSTENNFLLQDADRVKNNSVRRVFYDPEGMVYRWKEGITSFVLYGDSYETTPNPNSTPPTTSEPFAGQDIVNILSLLISGEPYNFATFYKAAIKFDNFKRDAGSNQDPSNSYFRGLKEQLKYRNLIYGNFIPFKQLTMDDATFAQVLNHQLNAIQYDGELRDLLKQRASLADKLAIFGKNASQTISKTNNSDQNISSVIKSIDKQIGIKIQNINGELNSAGNPPIQVLGDDISFDYDTSNLNSGSQTRLDDASRRELRRKVAFLTRRLAWKVRANEDVNFLIVDDTYDKDYDVQAFEKIFTNPELFKSEYITVASNIESVSKILDLEIFSNTQGHIELRVPKYNRMPSSVFYKMFKLKNELGIQIFPQFLEDLSINQLDGSYTQIEVLEDEIRIYCLALGYATDNDCVRFINSLDTGGGGSTGKRSASPTGFQFLSDETSGKINSNVSLNALAQPETLMSAIGSFQSQTSLNLFSLTARASLVQSAVLPPANSNNPAQFSNQQEILSNTSTKSRLDSIVARLQQKTTQTFNVNQLFSNSKSLATISSVDILQISDGIATRLSSRQRAIKTAVGAMQSIREGTTLSQGSGGPGAESLGNSLLYPTLYRSKNIPKIFEHMIEDESYDDLGPGSGSRYVIKNREIISYDISEKGPPFTSIEVVGRIGDLFIQNNELPQDLNVFHQGNALTTAAAIDYDLWRMYGIRLPQSIDAPYISDPETQGRPFAVAKLNKARKEILSGSLIVVGNEYQQPGEVIYLENRDILFYVESVSHNFTYNSGFTTSMSLRYGHSPGEYIPTYLDVIGKVLYKNNKDTVNLVNKRQGNVFNQEHVGSIVGNYNFNNSSTGFGTIESDILTTTGFSETNRLSLQKIIDYAGQSLALASDNINPILEIRVYYNSKNSNFSSANSYAQQLQNEVYNYLIGASELSSNSMPTASTQSNSIKLSAFKSQIKMISVDSSAIGEFRYPSAKAFYYSRTISEKSSSSNSQSSTPSQQDIDNGIYSYIVDCWIVFNNPALTTPQQS